MNLTVVDTVTITPGTTAYLPWEMYLAFLTIAFVFFVMSITLKKSAKFTCIISTVMFPMMAMLSWAIEFHDIAVNVVGGTEVYTIPYSYVVAPPYLSTVLLAFFFAGIVNCYYLWIVNAKEIADSVPTGRGI